MSDLYTDAEVQAAKKAVEEHGEWSKRWAPDAPLCIATDILPVVAPAIAAKALRDFAASFDTFDHDYDNAFVAAAAEERADEIEGKS
ncbi:hypothetical protein UB45_07600 [Terrabacter sp. 28]|nr:hypothetical protein UB45_07600 [Terrabacter sp. 28]